MKDEFDLSKMKKRKNVKSSTDLKVIKTIRLDLDVIMWLNEKAKEEGVGYQTFLNSFLKRSMNKEDKFEEIFKRLEKLEKKLK